MCTSLILWLDIKPFNYQILLINILFPTNWKPINKKKTRTALLFSHQTTLNSDWTRCMASILDVRVIFYSYFCSFAQMIVPATQRRRKLKESFGSKITPWLFTTLELVSFFRFYLGVNLGVICVEMKLHNMFDDVCRMIQRGSKWIFMCDTTTDSGSSGW